MAVNDGTCLCARGLPAFCQEEDVDALFRSCGRVAHVRMPLEPLSKASRGYAFVTVDTPLDAQACIAALNGVEFGGCRLTVEVSKRKEPHVKTPGVYLGAAGLCDGPAPRGPGASPGPGGLRRHDGAPPARCGRSPPRCSLSGARRPLGVCRAPGSSSCMLAESSRASAAAPPAEAAGLHASSPVMRGRGLEPATEPAIEPGGEPPTQEDPLCCAEVAPKGTTRSPRESPRSRIRRLEEANIRAVGKQTADALVLQFQQQGFPDPRAAAHECLALAAELLGGGKLPASAFAATDSEMAAGSPQVLVGPDEFKNPSSFLRVYGDPLAKGARGGGYQPASHQDGNWRCEQCSNVNYPRRQRCHKCHAIRGPAGDALVMQYCLQVFEMLSKGKQVD